MHCYYTYLPLFFSDEFTFNNSSSSSTIRTRIWRSFTTPSCHGLACLQTMAAPSLTHRPCTRSACSRSNSWSPTSKLKRNRGSPHYLTRSERRPWKGHSRISISTKDIFLSKKVNAVYFSSTFWQWNDWFHKKMYIE